MNKNDFGISESELRAHSADTNGVVASGKTPPCKKMYAFCKAYLFRLGPRNKGFTNHRPRRTSAMQI